MNLIELSTHDFRPLLGAFILLLVALSILREQHRLNREKVMLDRMAQRGFGSDAAVPRRGAWQSRTRDHDASES